MGTPNTNGVLCYRLQFGFYDSSSTRSGVEGVTALGTSGYLGYSLGSLNQCGDFETFTQMGQEVDQAIALIRSRHPNAEIVLLGHSRGGLAARSFLQGTSPQRTTVSGLVTTSSPHLGSRLGLFYQWLAAHPRSNPANEDDWEVADFLNSPTLMGVFPKQTLDVRRPVIDDVSVGSTALTALNASSAVAAIPTQVRVGTVIYFAADLGKIASGYSVLGSGLQPLPQVTSAAEAFILGAGNTATTFKGDGLVPGANQAFTQLPGFIARAIIPRRVVSDHVVLHTEATEQVADLVAQLRLVALGWWP